MIDSCRQSPALDLRRPKRGLALLVIVHAGARLQRKTFDSVKPELSLTNIYVRRKQANPNGRHDQVNTALVQVHVQQLGNYTSSRPEVQRNHPLFYPDAIAAVHASRLAINQMLHTPNRSGQPSPQRRNTHSTLGRLTRRGKVLRDKHISIRQKTPVMLKSVCRQPSHFLPQLRLRKKVHPIPKWPRRSCARPVALAGPAGAMHDYRAGGG